MNGWVKYFSDGTHETGYDQAVWDGKASWTRGRQDNMSAVATHHGDMHICISSPGEYWQSDDWEVPVQGKTPRCVVRRLQRKVTSSDLAIGVYRTTHSVMYKFVELKEASSLQFADSVRNVKDQEIGTWFTLELDVDTKKIKFYFSKEKI